MGVKDTITVASRQRRMPAMERSYWTPVRPGHTEKMLSTILFGTTFEDIFVKPAGPDEIFRRQQTRRDPNSLNYTLLPLLLVNS
jgi:hypothetical protein